MDAGTYPLSRPLFIYSDAKIMTEKPQVADFINYYLTNVNDEIIDGRLLPGQRRRRWNAARQNWLNPMK